MSANEITICQGCGKGKILKDGREQWIKVPPCFTPKPSVTITVGVCPDCVRKN